MKNTDKSKYINGPQNAFRMEGNIDGVKKVIYLFADVHVEPTDQTQCDSIRAIEIKDYLLENFDKLDNMVDFFLEIQPYYINLTKHKYRDKYLLSLRYFFIKCFNFDIKKNKIYTSTVLPNVRFHYMDIRPLICFNVDLMYHSDFILENHKLIEYYRTSNFNISNELVDKYVKYIQNVHDNMIFINNELFDYKTTIEKEKEKYYDEKMYSLEYIFDEKIAKNIIKKMYDAENANTMTILKTINAKYVKPKILKCISISEKILYLFEKYKKYSGNERYNSGFIKKFMILKLKIYKHMYILKNYVSIVGVLLSDMYFIRRFLDKKYITNGIIYGGSGHTLNYIFLLMKYFNFKITNFSYMNTTIDELLLIIKKTKDNYDFTKLDNFIQNPFKNIYQCSDLSSFPEKFV